MFAGGGSTAVTAAAAPAATAAAAAAADDDDDDDDDDDGSDVDDDDDVLSQTGFALTKMYSLVVVLIAQAMIYLHCVWREHPQISTFHQLSVLPTLSSLPEADVPVRYQWRCAFPQPPYYLHHHRTRRCSPGWHRY